jgi:hypothetical protein
MGEDDKKAEDEVEIRKTQSLFLYVVSESTTP